MELISPLLLYEASGDLHNTYNLIAAGRDKYPAHTLVTQPDCEKIARLMGRLQAELLKLNCVAAAESATKPVAHMASNSLTYGLLLRFVDEVDGRIRDEVKKTYAFCLNHLEAAFFNPATPLLGEEVARKFESAAFDIDEAGKCHALGRSTAAVFHAFRVLEIGIIAVAQCLSVPDLDKPRMKNWGFILDAIEKAIKRHWPKEADRDTGDGELFWEVYTLMLAIKAPRNRTMHPRRKYTEQEADRMLRVIGDVMMRLATRIDEKGEPKV